jgi:hypothetical protein
MHSPAPHILHTHTHTHTHTSQFSPSSGVSGTLSLPWTRDWLRAKRHLEKSVLATWNCHRKWGKGDIKFGRCSGQSLNSPVLWPEVPGLTSPHFPTQLSPQALWIWSLGSHLSYSSPHPLSAQQQGAFYSSPNLTLSA